MQLTVAICTYNPDKPLLLRALSAVFAQDAASEAEVIVVDNNSTPSLADQQYLGDYALRLIHEPRPGLTAAREAAINAASGEVIVFVDDDNILGPDYLSKVLREFTGDSRLGLLGGSILPEYDSPPKAWFAEFEHWLAIRRHTPELRVETTAPPFSSNFPVGAGLAIRRDLAVAYLDDCNDSQRIEGRRGDALSSGEDLDLGLFVLSQGCKLAVVGDISLTHVISLGRTSTEYLERLAVGNVKSALALEAKWSPRLGAPVYTWLSPSWPSLLTRTAATWLLSTLSPRYRIKYRIYRTLARARLGWPI